MTDIRDKLQAIPQWITIPALLIVIVALVVIGIIRASSAGDYDQPPITLRCSECGYQETLTLKEHARRMDEELPGGAALVEGPALKCPRCGKRAMLTVIEEAPPPGDATSAPRQ